MPAPLDHLQSLIDRLRAARWANLFVANLRIAVGFAFFPAGLTKLFGQPFTDPHNVGPFHDFLHTFLATGFFYRFVGVCQLVAAVLLLTQRRATLGAFLALPIAAAITAFCWSTARAPTVIVTTLITLGLAGLCLWDLRAFRPILDGRTSPPPPPSPSPPPIDLHLWTLCGLAVLLTYSLLCLSLLDVYRPRRPTPDSAAYYVLPALALMPVVTYLLERRRRRAGKVCAPRLHPPP